MNPGVCALCGASSPDGRKYVDTGWDIDWYGVVYFCSFCFTEIANHLGCLTKEQTDILENELDVARQRIINFNAKERALDDAIKYLRDSGLFDYINDGDSPHLNPASVKELHRRTTGQSGNPVSDKPRIIRTRDETEPLIGEQRSNDVSEFGIDGL